MWLSGELGHGWWPGFPVGQHYKITMSAHCHKLVPVLIWPYMLLGHKTTNKPTHMHTCTHRTIANAHMHTRTYAQYVPMYTCAHGSIDAHILAYTHVQRNITAPYQHMNAHMHMCKVWYISMCTRVCKYKYLHIYAHAHTGIAINTGWHIHMQRDTHAHENNYAYPRTDNQT